MLLLFVHTYHRQRNMRRWPLNLNLVGSQSNYLRMIHGIYGAFPMVFGVFADLFTALQLTALTTFSDLVAEARAYISRDASNAGLTDDGVALRSGGVGATAYADAVSSLTLRLVWIR